MIDIYVYFDELSWDYWEGFDYGLVFMVVGGCIIYFDMFLNGVFFIVIEVVLWEKKKLVD